MVDKMKNNDVQITVDFREALQLTKTNIGLRKLGEANQLLDELIKQCPKKFNEANVLNTVVEKIQHGIQKSEYESPASKEGLIRARDIIREEIKNL